MKDLRSRDGVKWCDFPSTTVPGDRDATNDSATWKKAALLRLIDMDGEKCYDVFSYVQAGWGNRHGVQIRSGITPPSGSETYDTSDFSDPLHGAFAMLIGNEDVVIFAFPGEFELLDDMIGQESLKLELIGVVDIDDPQYADVPLI